MRVITLLNKFYYLKSFVYENDQIEMIKKTETYVVDIVPRKNGKAVCSVCGDSCRTYDHQKNARLYEFIPLWGMKVYFRYLVRRVDCQQCGVRVESVPWAEGKCHLTHPLKIF